MSMASVIDYGVKRPIRERINFRLLTIIIVFGLLVGWPVYMLVADQMSHGIRRNGNRFDVDLKRMGFFPFDDKAGTVNDIPAEDRALDGKEISLEGFIAPTDVSGDRVNHFQLVYNVAKCCYGGPPKVQERVFAFIPNGNTIEYTTDEIRVIGTLHVLLNRDKETGKVLTVYVMEVKKVEQL
jgi:hypothetical protein